MQLNQGLESADGGSGGVGVDQPSDERKKMNMISRDFLVIFYFFRVLVVKGDVLCSTLIYLPLSQKKIKIYNPSFQVSLNCVMKHHVHLSCYESYL